jgi:hypothetical protein
VKLTLFAFKVAPASTYTPAPLSALALAMVTPFKVKVLPAVTLKSLAKLLPLMMLAFSAPLMVTSLSITIPFMIDESNSAMYA